MVAEYARVAVTRLNAPRPAKHPCTPVSCPLAPLDHALALDHVPHFSVLPQESSQLILRDVQCNASIPLAAHVLLR